MPTSSQRGGSKTGFAARRDHSLHATSPLFDESELMEHPSDGPVSEFGNAEGQVIERKSERKQAGILYLYSIIEDGESDRGAALRVVGMGNGVDDRFADGRDRDVTNAPCV